MTFGAFFNVEPEEKPVAEKPAAKAPKVSSEPKKPAPRKKTVKGDAQ